MSLLNLRKSKGIIACLVILQLSITGAHPVRSSGTAETSNVDSRLIQRVARNDPDRGYEQFEDQAEVVAPTGAPFSEGVVMDQETSATESSVIQEEINPFISSDSVISNGPESLEIVTPSFLDNQNVPVWVSDAEPMEKLEDPSTHPEIVADPFYNSPAHSPSEAQWPPAAPSDSSNDVPAIPTDLPVAIHSLSTFGPISDEVEPIQKLEEPSFDPLVVFPPVSSEAEPLQKPEDLSFDRTAVPVSNEPELIHNVETPSNEPLNIIAPIVHEDVPIPVSNEPELIHNVETPSSEPLDVIAPVLHEDAPNQSIVDPSVDSLIITAPVSDETVPIHDNHSVDVPSFDASISNEAQQNVEDPSVNPVEVAPVLVQDVPEIDTRIVAEPVTNIVANHPSEVAHQEPQSPPAAPSEIDFPPQAVFISTVFPASPITVAPFKAQEPVSPSLYSVTNPKKPAASYSVTHPPKMATMVNIPSPVKTQLKSYPAGQQLKQQYPKQSPDYGKIKAQSNPISNASPNAQAQINQPKYQVTSPTSSPTPAYGPPRATLATSYGNNKFPTRPFGSSPKPRQLGFPPVSNTRDNVLLQVNWAANVGRPYRST
ncbi:proline-rich extensin-like protein EPR1 [Daphnia magna]|uniref:proline-rich extensin-like protein EPR1 n=1 Tax=Daphnia magna TaxID=35525 RepID=UPI001E1B9FC5|nr:proline-rich extensin-like protein EPR1 [Daphnia magna]